jgi:hypothetical protein
MGCVLGGAASRLCALCHSLVYSTKRFLLVLSSEMRARRRSFNVMSSCHSPECLEDASHISLNMH